MTIGERWDVKPPLPKAPAGYDGPPPPDDAVNVLIILEPGPGCVPPDDPKALSQPINRFVTDLAQHLGQLANLSTWAVNSKTLKYQEDLPTGISAVVTNDVVYAEWCRSWGGNSVRIELVGDSLVVATRDGTQAFGPDDQEDATNFAMREVTRPSREGVRDLVDNASADAETTRDWDVFISHATEDKETVAGPLAHALRERGVSVWYDEFELRVGDSLRRSIDSGITNSRFGLVILSKPFFDKNWPQYELDGLVTRTNSDQQILLPIWHEISKDEVIAHSSSLADRIALRTSDHGIKEIADEIASVITSQSQMLATRHT